MKRFTFLFSTCLLISASLWAQSYTISTAAGTDRVLNGTNASGVPLRNPRYVAIDSAGNIYISDTADARIRRVTSSGIISTLAGTGQSGYSGDRGKATLAQISSPWGITADSSGNVFFADRDNNVVRRVSLDGTINTVAGNGSQGSSGDNGSATSAQLDPIAVTVDKSGNLYIADASGYRIRKVDTKGIITTIAGSGSRGYAGDNGLAVNALISVVSDITVDSSGNVYFADFGNYRVRKIDTAGMMTTVAGSGTFGLIGENVPAAQSVMIPQGVSIDVSGNLLLSDFNRDLIRRVDKTSGLITTVGGNGSTGFSGDNDSALKAQLNTPWGMAVDGTGQIFFADNGNLRIRKIAASVITTFAGTGIRDGGAATSAFLSFPQGIATDSNGNFVVADTGNFEARKFTLGGNVSSFGQLKGAPLGVAVDPAANFYISDDEPRILKVTPGGVTSIVAGNGQSGYTGDGGSATSASITSATGVAADAAGNVYFTDVLNGRIRKVQSGTVTTIAGSGKLAATGDGGPALSAGMNPIDVAVDSKNNIYFADFFNNTVRKIATDGTISTIAGNGVPGYSGDGGLATAAALFLPTGVAVDTGGNVYIADNGNAVVRRVTPTGLITTIAGNGTFFPATGDGGAATAAQLDPWRVAVDSTGSVYVTDNSNDRVRKLTPKVVSAATMSVVSGNGQSGFVGTQLASPLVVKVVDAGGAPVPGQLVNFAVSPAGAATVTPSPSITLNDGTASAAVTLGAAPGSITITASAGSATVPFTVTANPAVSATAPVITHGGIASSGLSSPAVASVSPNAIVSIFGQKFAPEGSVRILGTDDLVGGRVPTILNGVCVLFGTQRAPIFAILPGQLNVQVPKVTGSSVQVQVITKCDTPLSETSNTETVAVQTAAPEFFYFAHNGSGNNPIAAINAVSGAYIGSPGLVAGATFTPAKTGDILTLFATGFGLTSPEYATGELPAGIGQVTDPVSVTFGGVKLAAADVLYVGVSGYAGLYQLNIRVPAGLPDGDQAVVLTIGTVPSPAGLVNVKN